MKKKKPRNIDLNQSEEQNEATDTSAYVHTVSESGHAMKIYIDMYARGRRRALESGDIEPNPNDLESLTEQAAAAAREVAQETYDPKANPQDKIRESEYQKNLNDRKEAEQGEKHAAGRVREKESVLAKIKGIMQKPTPPAFITVGGISMIALSLMTTNHDIFFYSFEDDILSWGLSLACGLFVGLFVSWSILEAIETSGEKSILNWGGFVGGIVLVIGFAVLRLSEADTNAQLILCLALTLIEVGAIILLEFVARGLREETKVWASHKQMIDTADAELQAALQDLKRWQNIISQIDGKLKAHLAYVESKVSRHLNVDRLEANAVKSIKDGYYDGIAVNRGKIFGNSNNTEDDDE